MGSVSVFSCQGIKLWFNSSDHQPPHLHAKKPGEWEVRVHIVTGLCGVVWRQKRIRQADLDCLLSGVQLNRFDLLREWEEKVCL